MLRCPAYDTGSERNCRVIPSAAVFSEWPLIRPAGTFSPLQAPQKCNQVGQFDVTPRLLTRVLMFAENFGQ